MLLIATDNPNDILEITICANGNIRLEGNGQSFFGKFPCMDEPTGALRTSSSSCAKRS